MNEKKDEFIDGLYLKEDIEISDNMILESNNDIMNLFKMTPYYYKTGIEGRKRLENTELLESEISFLIRVYVKE